MLVEYKVRDVGKKVVIDPKTHSRNDPNVDI
jgi:hypothetical protein